MLFLLLFLHVKFAVDVGKCCLKFTGYAKLPFKWFDYLRETDSIAAPVKLFNKVIKIIHVCTGISIFFIFLHSAWDGPISLNTVLKN